MALPAAGQLKTFIDDVLQHVPEDKRDAVRSSYSKAQDAATTLETAIANVNDTATKQRLWWDTNKDAVEERNQLRTRVGELEKRPADGVDPDKIQKAIETSRNEVIDMGLGLATTLADISSGHLKEFGEVINTRQLAEAAIAAKKPLDVFYAETVADRRQKRNDEARAAELATARAEGEQAGMKRAMEAGGRALPYPTNSAPVTTLQGLRKPADGSSPYSLEAAVATAVEVASKQQ